MPTPTRTEPSTSSRNPAVVGTYAAITGAALCALVGAVLGTVIWPVVVTFFASLAGAGIGLVAGPAVGLAFAATLRRRESVTEAVLASTAVGAVVGCGITLETGSAGAPVGAVAGAVLGGAFGALVALSTDRAFRRRTRSPAAPDPFQVLGRYAFGGLILATAIGAVGGLVIGLVTYLPTSPVALVEGAILMAPPGVVLGAAAGLVRAQFPPRSPR